MPTTSQTLAVAPLDGFRPKPTKRDILLATATALHGEHLKEQAELSKAIAKAEKKLKDAARKLLLKSKALLREKDGYLYSSTVEFSFSFRFDLPELKPLHDELSKLRGKREPMTVEDFAQELRGRASSTSNLVPALLADPQIKAALLAAGKSALTRVSAEDQASAVEA